MTDEMSVAVEAVRPATTILRSQAVSTVDAKGDRDLVPDLDRTVEEDLRAFLARETPTIGFLGEESSTEHDHEVTVLVATARRSPRLPSPTSAAPWWASVTTPSAPTPRHGMPRASPGPRA